MASKRDHFLLRLSPGLLDTLKKWADDELRSTNAQIEYLLADAVRRAGRKSERPPAAAPPAAAPPAATPLPEADEVDRAAAVGETQGGDLPKPEAPKTDRPNVDRPRRGDQFDGA